MALPRHYKRGIDYLNKEFPFFTVMVTSLGKPVVDNHIVGYVGEGHEFLDEGTPIYRTPTLQVQRARIDDEGFELCINEEFLSDKTDAEVGAVLAHEAFHIIKSHLNELGMEEYNATLQLRKKALLAHECITNDNVVNEGFDLPDLRLRSKKTGELKGGLYFGPDVVDRSVAYYTTKEVMDLIEDDNEAFQNLPDDAEQEHYVILSDEEMKELQDIMEKNIRHAVFEGKIDPDDVNSDELKTILKVHQVSKKAGTTASKSQAAFTKKGLSLKWMQYLLRIDPTAFRDGGSMGEFVTNWATPRKKLIHMYPKVNLPVYKSRFVNKNKGGLKPHIVLALDFSGSIPPEMTTVMGNLARAIPDTIEVHCCTFSTEYVPFDHKIDGTQPVASGGTDFSAIQKYIDTLDLKKQPSVVVITDGEASFGSRKPTQEALDHKWNWLMIDRGNQVYDRSVKPETVNFLQDYLLDKQR